MGNIASWVSFSSWSGLAFLTRAEYGINMFLTNEEYLLSIFIFIVISMLAAFLSGIITDKTFNRMILVIFGFTLISVGFIVHVMALMHKNYLYLLLANIAVGSGFGLNISSLGAYFGDLTDPRDRGKLQGIALALGYLLALGLMTMADIIFAMGFLMVIVLIGIIMGIYFARKPSERFEREKNTKEEGFSSLFKNKNFLYYITSFLLFLIALPMINVLFEPIYNTTRIEESTVNILGLSYLLIFPVLALISGIAIDYGRKAVVSFLFITLGFGFVIWGITPEPISVTPVFLIFISLFLTMGNSITNILDYTISVDFAEPRSRGRLVSIFYLASSVGLMISTTLRAIIENLEITTLALIVTFFMLLSIVPVVLATRPLDEALAKQVNVKVVFIVTNEGRCMVDVTFKGISVETDLITGALSAVGDLIKESVHSEKRLKTIDQEDVKIMISYGQHVNACVIADKETVELRKKIDSFLRLFEEKYEQYIVEWSGALRPFMGAYKTIEEIFGIYA